MSCVCDSYSYPYFAERRRARLEHKCYECGARIRPGDIYEHVWGICEGDGFTAKTCTRCLELRDYVQAHVPCFCLEHGNLHEGAIETAQEWAHEAPGLLFGAYRRLLKCRERRV